MNDELNSSGSENYTYRGNTILNKLFDVAISVLLLVGGAVMSYTIGRVDRNETELHSHVALVSHPGTAMEMSSLRRELDLMRAENTTAHLAIQDMIRQYTARAKDTKP